MTVFEYQEPAILNGNLGMRRSFAVGVKAGVGLQHFDVGHSAAHPSNSRESGSL